MTTPQQQIEQDLTAAMKAREKERVSTLRLLLTAIKNERIRLGEDVDEATFLHLVQKAIKQRQDSVEQYRQGNREDLATKEEREAEILAVYLPPPSARTRSARPSRSLWRPRGLSASRAWAPS